MWYTDDSIFLGGGPQFKTYMLESTDSVTWFPSPDHATSLIGLPSIDVKYDPNSAEFVLVTVANEFTSTSYLARSYSADGMNWTPLETVVPPGQFPAYAHDPGWAGDETGNLIRPNTLVAFGAPYFFADVNSSHWNLYGTYIGDWPTLNFPPNHQPRLPTLSGFSEVRNTSSTPMWTNITPRASRRSGMPPQQRPLSSLGCASLRGAFTFCGSKCCRAPF
jgi:hypothetical protein